jgi:hypothetical protein
MSRIPPGLTCDQYYLYLASGYTYSSKHGIMYNTSQMPSEHLISKFLPPSAFGTDEITYWLQHRYCYDFNRKCWTQATFTEPLKFQEQIWHDASRSQVTFLRVQQKANEVMEMMASMSLDTDSRQSASLKCSINTERDAKSSACPPLRDRVAVRREDLFKDDLRRVLVKESKQKSKKLRAVKEKIRTLPISLARRAEFWKTVL